MRNALMLLILVAATPFLPGETILVAHKWDDSVGFYDAATGAALLVVPAGRKPHEMEFSADRRFVYVTNYGVDSYTDTAPGENTLTVIDLEKRAIAFTIDLARYRRPHGIHLGKSGLLYLTAEIPGAVVVVDPKARRVVRGIEVGQKLPHMLVISSDERKAYTANSGSGTVTAVDLRSGRIAGQIEVGGVPMGIAWGPGEKRLYVATRTANTVAVIDPQSDMVLRQIPVPGQPVRLALWPDPRYMAVTLIESGELVVLNLASNSEQRRLAAGARAEGIGVDARRGFVYVSAQADNKVVKFSAPDFKKVLEIPARSRPDPILVLPDGR